jgi:hypothetical protein
MEKTFTRAGISNNKGKVQFRFTNDLNRERVLHKNGHTDIVFYELGEPMTKAQATEFLVAQGLVEDVPAKPKAAAKPRKAKEPTRADDEKLLAMLDAGAVEYDDGEDTFVEPKDEAVQVAMTRKAREYPGLNAHQLLEMVQLDMKAFPETAGEPTF